MNKYFILLSALAPLWFSCSLDSDGGERGEATMRQIVYDTVLVPEYVMDTLLVEKEEADTVFVDRAVMVKQNSEFYIRELLPDWLTKSNLLDGTLLQLKYRIDPRLNPLYFEDDFNDDGHIDIAIPIRNIENDKLGFAIIHGSSFDTHIIGAGVRIKNGLQGCDDLGYVEYWKVSRQKTQIDLRGEDSVRTVDIIASVALQILVFEVGGGVVYWNGNEYAYFHQTC